MSPDSAEEELISELRDMESIQEFNSRLVLQ